MRLLLGFSILCRLATAPAASAVVGVQVRVLTTAGTTLSVKLPLTGSTL